MEVARASTPQRVLEDLQMFVVQQSIPYGGLEFIGGFLY